MNPEVPCVRQVLVAAVKVYAALEKGRSLSTLVVECINDVIDPLDEESNSEQMQQELTDLREQKAVLLTDEKYAELAAADSRLKDLEKLENVREGRWSQALAMTCELLQHVTKMDVALQGLFALALCCLALALVRVYWLLSKKVSMPQD